MADKKQYCSKWYTSDIYYTMTDEEKDYAIKNMSWKCIITLAHTLFLSYKSLDRILARIRLSKEYNYDIINLMIKYLQKCVRQDQENEYLELLVNTIINIDNFTFHDYDIQVYNISGNISFAHKIAEIIFTYDTYENKYSINYVRELNNKGLKLAFPERFING